MIPLLLALFAQSHALPLAMLNQPDNRLHALVNQRLSANESQAQHFLKKKHSDSQACTSANTIFDLGFYDGGDSQSYLVSGYYCVVGVEADPELYASAQQNFAGHIASGRLKLMNVAVAPEGDSTAWTTFYKSNCTKEWNSFYTSIGCRQCAPPHSLDETMCTAVKVKATDCSGIFAEAGTPHYLKLDIEGAETGCFQAMSRFAGKPLPQYVSAEITELKYIDTLHQLGYTGFKLVRQDHLNTVQANSGPWGENAYDCKTGAAWRTYADVRAEFTTVLGKPLNAAEACPGGVMPIHGPPKPQNAYIWYDIHAQLTPTPAPR